MIKISGFSLFYSCLENIKIGKKFVKSKKKINKFLINRGKNNVK